MVAKIAMSKVSRSVEISAPVEAVFAYYARPEHIAKTFPEDVKMKVVPINVKDGFGVGTIFRISGDFGGRFLEWDNETIAYENNKLIQTKAINGPFKKNDITVKFDAVPTGTKLTFEADYDIGYSIFGKTLDKLKIKKEVEMGIERSCAAVKQYVES
ncbi:MAG: SRPBCC family protein, partial [Nitrososphaerales archaeon]